MIAFLTSSPCIPNADRAILNPANDFVNRMRAALPEHPRCLFVCSHPDSAYLTDKYAGDMDEAFAHIASDRPVCASSLPAYTTYTTSTTPSPSLS